MVTSDGPKPPPFWLHFSAGGIAGTIGAAVTCPLEVVKTRLQSSLFSSAPVAYSFAKQPLRATYAHITGVISALVTIRRTEGITALWKGLGPNLVGVVPARAIYFGVYSQGKHAYTELNGGVESSFIHMVSAATAGLSVATFTNPIWLVKTRMQLQSQAKLDVNPTSTVNAATNAASTANATLKTAREAVGIIQYKNSLHCAYHVIKTEGIKGLYRGFSASMLGLTESTLQFVTYEYFKKALQDGKIKDDPILNAQNSKDLNNTSIKRDLLKKDIKLSTIETLSIASTAKLFAAVLTYPHEVVRTRLRQSPQNNVRKYTGLVQTFLLVWREEGVGGLYGGMTAHLMRVVPNAAILFFMYEFMLKLAAN